MSFAARKAGDLASGSEFTPIFLAGFSLVEGRASSRLGWRRKAVLPEFRMQKTGGNDGGRKELKCILAHLRFRLRVLAAFWPPDFQVIFFVVWSDCRWTDELSSPVRRVGGGARKRPLRLDPQQTAAHSAAATPKNGHSDARSRG